MKRDLGVVVCIFFLAALFSAYSLPAASADLFPTIKCPGKAVPGQELGKSIKVMVENKGDVTAARFAVDLVLSSDMAVPMKYAVYSAAFKEDCLLQGGREHEMNLAPHTKRAVTLNGNNRIPADTPPGVYYLAAVIDPGDEVSESNERNNIAFCRITVVKKMLSPAFKPGSMTIAKKKPDLGMYGFLKLGNNKRQVKWGETITLTPADATLISNGKPAFDVYYSCREYRGVAAGPFKNKLFFKENLVSKQTNLNLKPKEIRPIHTQAYLGPQSGRLKINIDADNEVAESREDNNFNFYVNLRFKGFPAAKKLPDLIVKEIALVNDCKMKITIANIGSAGVPAAGYDMKNGVGIQMYRFSNPWGGIRLGAVDPGGNLKSPGGTVSWVWFPGAANLNLTPGIHSIKVVVDNNNAVMESNENNNHLTRRLNCRDEEEEPDSGQPCGIRLDRLSTTRGRPGSTFRMYGRWGGRQGTKIPCINKGGMNRLIVKRWTSTTLEVQVPTGLERGFYKVGVYCSDPALGTTYSSGWLDFRVL